ncbi:MAG: NUDIX domain-containing protein [Actinomycetota bacterium]|nr:NUDIX domain-containing protein [Actinomycetota bacterium]
MSKWIEERKGAGGHPSGADAAPAATVVLLRDGETGLEVLLGKRSSKLAFHGGAWVFPGGRIDPEDYADDADDVVAAARRAAVREAKEEAGVDVEVDVLVHLSNWTTPEISPKRFATWFFVGPVAGGNEIADGAETDKIQWFGPQEALDARAVGEIELAPPQYVTLLELVQYGSVAEAMIAIGNDDPVDYTPRFQFLEDGGAVCVYAEDVAYFDLGQMDKPGPRHRLILQNSGWEYVRE